MTLGSPRFGLRLAALGAAGLGALMAVLPTLGDGDANLAEHILALVLVVFAVGVFLYGLLVFAADLTLPKLFSSGAIAVALGFAAVYLGGHPEELAGDPSPLPLALLFLADVFRIAAAACAGLFLARFFISPTIALLLAVVAAAVDTFSVFAGPTKSLIEERATSLDYLLLWFPTFASPSGFSLGLSDFFYLALFAAVAHRLGLRPLATLALGCAAVIIALLAVLLLTRPLPALPFIALSFILANAAPLYKSFSKKNSP